MRRTISAAVGLGLAIALGCGGVQRGTVQGVVKLGGEPLAETTVIFIGSDNMTYLADTEPDGRYRVTGVPYGRLKVSVQKHLPKVASKSEFAPAAKELSVEERADNAKSKRKPADEPAPAAPKTGAIPARYADAEQSKLDFELNAPALDHDIELVKN